MKLDLSDPIIQRIVHDERPIALRKRRRSIIDNTTTLPKHADCKATPKTPRKAKKKVRFSDPGPATTGLTPALRSTSLGLPFGTIDRSEIKCPVTPSRRRASLPPINTAWNPDDPMEIQFTPIRQLLTPRLKRQIARKDLSDEMNKIEDEKKVIDRQEVELSELRKELCELRRAKTPADTTYVEDSQLNLPDLNDVILTIPETQAMNSNDPCNDAPVLETAGIFIDPDCIDIDASQSKSFDPSTISDAPLRINQAMQTEAALTELENHVEVQTAHLTKARLELERIFPGETTLPLTPPVNGDCSPLLNAMLGHLQAAHQSLRSTKQSLSNVQTQKTTLQSNFNQSLAKLDVAREAYADLLKGARAGAEKYAQARQRISTLEGEIEEETSTSDKLRRALETYRAEVHALENLITRLEEESKTQLEKVQSDMNETVADLECKVAAETRGRREAESEMDERTLQVLVLEGSQEELKEALNEKQAIVRNLEDELVKIKLDKNQEVGSLNVRISRLEEELACARIDIERLKNEKSQLQDQFAAQQTRQLDSVAQLKNELRKAVTGVECIVGGWEKDVAQESDSIRIAGLMTPSVEGGRFRDVAMDTVDGSVEMTRGKSRRVRKVDSAIGLLEQDMMDE